MTGSLRRSHRSQTVTPASTFGEAGSASTDKALTTLFTRQLSQAGVRSVPLTLVIFVLVFGSLLAAWVPLMLGLMAVVATMGLTNIISHVTPMDQNVQSVVLLIGLAVGVDYTLFYLRREREGTGATSTPVRFARSQRPLGDDSSVRFRGGLMDTIVGRLIGDQAELFPDWRHHAFATNRTTPTHIADLDHRDHATIELAIRDLKDQALAHVPSGQMHANSAWTVIAAVAHNLGRWTTHIGQPNQPVQTARTRRRQLLRIPARLTRTSRRWTLPARWPWQNDFTTVLDAIRALPALT